MQWFGRRESDNVEDRRGFGGGGLLIGGGLGATVLYFIINFLFGGDASNVLQSAGPDQTQASGVQHTQNNVEDSMAHFASVMLADNEDVWTRIFSDGGATYTVPKLVLFNGQTPSACGYASSATGPFYCPSDQKVYLDLGFFQELKERFGAGGDFANAYVIAHEVGHHVQQLLGTTDKLARAELNSSSREANRYSVALELQADFYAGVWAHYEEAMKHIVEAGDLEQALSAASAIGDDHLQKMATGTVMPDAFTHGTSVQRMFWFKKGFTTGDINQGDTFNEMGLNLN